LIYSRYSSDVFGAIKTINTVRVKDEAYFFFAHPYHFYSHLFECTTRNYFIYTVSTTSSMLPVSPTSEKFVASRHPRMQQLRRQTSYVILYISILD